MTTAAARARVRASMKALGTAMGYRRKPGTDTLILELHGEIRASDEKGPGVRASEVALRLAANDDATQVHVDVDSTGGDVTAALSIYRRLREHRARIKTSSTSGVCMSAALLPFLACDHREASSTARFLLHQCADADAHKRSRATAGLYATLAKSLAKADSLLLDIMTERTRAPRDALANEMRNEGVIGAFTAMRLGLVHCKIGEGDLQHGNVVYWPTPTRAAAHARLMASYNDRRAEMLRRAPDGAIFGHALFSKRYGFHEKDGVILGGLPQRDAARLRGGRQ